jgi:Protein of unknown function (DUF3606)
LRFVVTKIVAVAEYPPAAPTALEGPVADDKSNRGEQDRIRVNVHEQYEVEYWTRKWGITAQQLRDAVAKVGVMVKDVAKHLGKAP